MSSAKAPAPSAKTSPPLLQVEGITKIYPGTVALDRVSFGLDGSEVLGLAGHNGAGKSTLTRLLAGVEQPDGGTIRIDGDELRLRSPEVAVARGIALVPQSLMLVPNLTVRENILLGVRSRGSDVRWFDGAAGTSEAVSAVAERLSLSAFLDSRVATLRPVSRRLVMIGRALLRDPRLIVLDEPTANLARAEVELLFDLVRKTVETGSAVIYITHRLDEMLELSDRIVVLRQGRIIAQCRVEDTSKARLGDQIAGTDLGDRLRTAASEVDVHEVDPALGATTAPGKEREELLRCERLTALPSTKEVSFSLHRGQVIGLAGLDGSGRTSLLRALWGDRRHDDGAVFVRGEKTSLKGVRSAITAGFAYLPEERASSALFPDMTVSENVAMPALRRFSGPTGLVREGRAAVEVQGLLKRLDTRPLDGAAGAKIKSFSGGNQQKMVIARWLLQGADVFMFDEPTQGIDVGAKEQVYEVIRELTEDGAGVIIASSEPEELERLCDSILLMRDGEVFATLNGDEVTEARISRSLIEGQ
jgi:ribose transport system ATP-binding protein